MQTDSAVEMKLDRKSLAARDGLIDHDAVVHNLGEILSGNGGTVSSKARSALLGFLKTVVKQGRAQAEQLLIEDGQGNLCARRLSSLQDDVIAIIHHVTTHYVFPPQNRSSGERMAVVAVGGYGRGKLAPGSDIDLLFLLPYKQTPWGESVVEYILYMLWDLNFTVGHATRNINECVRLSRADMTIRTSILEARFLLGDRSLYDEMTERFQQDVVRNTSAEFIEAKMAERDQRHSKAGGTRYLVEPDIKEGKGGLRDLHTLFWIAKYVYQVDTDTELVKAGVFNDAEYRVFRKSGDFLWTVRCHLHYLSGRAEERLSFDLQQEMAKRLNYKTHGGLLDVERFMKHYFLVAKDIGDLTGILAAKLEERQMKKAPGMSRLFASMRRGRSRKIDGYDAFGVDKKRIVAAQDDIFQRDPVNLIRAFKVADLTGQQFHPDLQHLMRRSLKLIDADLRRNDEANRVFLDILTSKRDPETLLRKMNEIGVLGRFVPDFGKIVAMMQFNMYHHYTVDEHTIRTLGVLSDIEHGRAGDDHPLSVDLIRQIDDRRILYIALFLHDIAKGRDEDHSIAGAKVAKRFGKRFGLTAAQTETISWLVLEHLTMSITAQSRDLSDPKTIRDFANIVQTPERLKLLLLLTVCDIRAVGPGVWNGWKGQLLRTLYYETEPILTGGYNTAAIDQRVDLAKDALSRRLSDWQVQERTSYVERHYPAYLLRTDLDTQVRHANLIREAQSNGKSFASTARTLEFEGITEVTFYVQDHPSMLSILAGSCARAGANIVGAQIYTTRDGFALDMVNLKREFTNDDELRRAERLADEVERTLAGEPSKDGRDGMSMRAVRRSTKAFSVATEIVINNTLSNRFTVIEASGKDRGGLLYDLSKEIFALNLNISSAHIATFGERAVDVFYVTDLMGEKITNKTRQNSIKKRLQKVFEPIAKPAKKAA